MEETPEEETARLLKPYRDEVLRASDEVIELLLSGRYIEAQDAMKRREMAVFAYETARGICDAYDNGNVTITDTWEE
jgi:hypothetical protein